MGFTHFDENGKAVMVDVTAKSETEREATATGRIVVNREVFQAIKAGTAAKGDVLGVAATAGIMGAKRTSDLIPMCHILPITNCRIHFDISRICEFFAEQVLVNPQEYDIGIRAYSILIAYYTAHPEEFGENLPSTVDQIYRKNGYVGREDSSGNRDRYFYSGTMAF